MAADRRIRPVRAETQAMEFTAGGARALLERLDQRIRATEAAILDGHCTSFDQVQAQIASRRAYHQCRTDLLAQLDDDTKRMLGVPTP